MAKRNGDDNSTRSLFSFGLLGLLNACIMVSPLDSEMQVKLAAALNPTVSLLAFLAYQFWDRWTE